MDKEKSNKGNLIYQRIPAIMAEIGVIGKDRQNKQQGYKFRGIDDVYNEIHDVLAKHKVFTVPTVLEDRHEERQSKAGGVLIYRILRVRYTFFTDDGSFVEADVIGEGMDSGDKAANKAMSTAHKYALLQVFAIPTEEPKDAENGSPEVGGKPKTAEVSKPKESLVRNIELTLSNGSKKMVTKFEALNYFAKIKEALGRDRYYEILGEIGYEHANEIPADGIANAFNLMVEAYQPEQDAPDTGEGY